MDKTWQDCKANKRIYIYLSLPLSFSRSLLHSKMNSANRILIFDKNYLSLDLHKHYFTRLSEKVKTRNGEPSNLAMN